MFWTWKSWHATTAKLEHFHGNNYIIVKCYGHSYKHFHFYLQRPGVSYQERIYGQHQITNRLLIRGESKKERPYGLSFLLVAGAGLEPATFGL
jgi:hypothetical protein